MKDYKFDLSSIDKTLDNLNSIEKNLSGLSDMHWELGANKTTKGSQKEGTLKNEQNNCVKKIVTLNEDIDNTINKDNISNYENPAIATKEVEKNALAGKENQRLEEAIKIIAFKQTRKQKAPVIKQKLNEDEGNISDDEKLAISTKKVEKNALVGKENQSVDKAIEIIAFKQKREQKAPSFLFRLVKFFMASLLLGTIMSYALRHTVCQNNTSDFCQGISKTTNSIDQN